MTIDPLWRIAATGRPRTWVEPHEAWDAAIAYFEWADANPVKDSKLVSFQGVTEVEYLPKLRAYSIEGFLLHAGISRSTWDKYKNDSQFSEIMQTIAMCIREQKFSGAAADVFNAGIIARDLGLSEKHEVTGADGGAIRTESITAAVTQQDAAEAYQRMIKGE